MKFRTSAASMASTWAMTLVETIVVVLITGSLVFYLVYANYFSRIGHGAHRIKCTTNLKNVGLAFRIYATDNDDQFPAASTNGIASWAFQPYSAYVHFRMLTNELTTPKVVICPEDKERKNHPVNFAGVTNNSGVSYFVGLVRDETTPLAILSGDRDITNSSKPINGFLTLSTNDRVGWKGTIHEKFGNIALGDGSVQQTTSAQLDALFKASAGVPDRLALPVME